MPIKLITKTATTPYTAETYVETSTETTGTGLGTSSVFAFPHSGVLVYQIDGGGSAPTTSLSGATTFVGYPVYVDGTNNYHSCIVTSTITKGTVLALSASSSSTTNKKTKCIAQLFGTTTKRIKNGDGTTTTAKKANGTIAGWTPASFPGMTTIVGTNAEDGDFTTTVGGDSNAANYLAFELEITASDYDSLYAGISGGFSGLTAGFGTGIVYIYNYNTATLENLSSTGADSHSSAYAYGGLLIKPTNFASYVSSNKLYIVIGLTTSGGGSASASTREIFLLKGYYYPQD